MRILSILLVALSLVSCSDPSSGVQGPGVPDVGSVFVVDVLQTRNGSDSLVKEELRVAVRVTDMLFEGKEHVVQLASDTILSLLSYESNGDLSVYARQEYVGICFVNGGWLRFPFGGETPVSDTLRGVPVHLSDEVRSCIVTWNARPDGEERVTIQGKEMEARRITGELVVHADSSGTMVPLHSLEFETAYVPALYYVAREDIRSLAYQDGIADTLGTSRRTLRSWKLSNNTTE